MLALHIANLALMVDPERIAVGGGMMGSAERVLSALRRTLERAVPFPPAVVCARFLHDAALRGAVALAVEISCQKESGVGAPSGAEAVST